MGEPLVLLHGVTDTPRTWDLVRPALEQRHEVVAPALLGHHGGPAFTGQATSAAITDAVERELDELGLDTAHVVGNSLGGRIALELAVRGRARSVVALAPAGGWRDDDPLIGQTATFFRTAQKLLERAAPRADEIAATPEGRARALAFMVEDPSHVPADLVAHQLRGAADCAIVLPMLDGIVEHGWPPLDGRVDVPTRVVWGARDKVLPWPSAAERYKEDLPDAEWIVLDGVGHLPQFDDPERTAELILEVSSR